MAKCFGSDATAGGLGFQMRGIKANARAQRAAVEAGKDPKDLGICSIDPGKGNSSCHCSRTAPPRVLFLFIRRCPAHHLAFAARLASREFEG